MTAFIHTGFSVAMFPQEQGRVEMWQIFLTSIRDLSVPVKMTLGTY